MDIRPYIKKASGKLLAAIAGALMLYACDGLIYDGEGDCSVSYRVKFRYDYNMKFADAFAHEVDVVTLYLLDADGRVVWQRTEQGEALAADGYAMTVDVEPGEYGLLAWCGTTDKGSFSIPETTVGKQLTCTLDRQHDAGNKAFVTEDLDRLFHGWLPEQTFGKTEGTYTYTVPLVKNTNNVRVVLQHISGEAVDKDRFVFTITGTNGSMDWDNTLLPDEPVTFYAWHTDAGEAGMDPGTEAMPIVSRAVFRLVQLGENTGDIHQKIYVKTQKKGNALIGAYNSKGDILWSWHIWVTDHEPDNLGRAVTYYTYDWDQNGIYPEKPRIQGYAVMSCNLGALAENQQGIGSGLHRYPDEMTQAFGMLYQWGRKDPFPPLRNIANEHQDYNDEHTDLHYDNSNQAEVHKTSATDENKLFHSVIGSALTGAVRHAIANPTVFICGTNEANRNESYVQTKSNYFNNGDWCPVGESDNKLWGGLEPASEGMKAYTINQNNNVHLYDNYGTEKSIFDPCPTGWRVASGELWLEFTNTGLNPGSMSDINYDDKFPNGYGMNMYMQQWKEGPTSYFPMQGTRVGDGGGIRTSSCGNYHNATTDTDNRVNILHIHMNQGLFHIFEYQFYFYYVKSVAGPVRCVRDSK